MEGDRAKADGSLLYVAAQDVVHVRDVLGDSHTNGSPRSVPSECRAAADRLHKRLTALQAADPRFQHVALSPYVQALLGS